MLLEGQQKPLTVFITGFQAFELLSKDNTFDCELSSIPNKSTSVSLSLFSKDPG